ncbi:hypothetical protein SADFL11_4013 [Roseibium alexandrii DFL-11]|uniref:Uncharacterized protein n=1 Tax=Roseibium alexandrii (strain DSM 17067 / NCIMB 14079 / DFL-11) TaxID=244592 RepID=A0A5E8H452_ROSAD|nr:hypothetical protein SADFL11_4013 [Roseibium alexandrii DFL-11]
MVGEFGRFGDRFCRKKSLQGVEFSTLLLSVPFLFGGRRAGFVESGAAHSKDVLESGGAKKGVNWEFESVGFVSAGFGRSG